MDLFDITEKTEIKIKDADQRLNEIAGYNAYSINSFIQCLLISGSVEVGYRSQCGATHSTQKIYREWIKIKDLLIKDGINIICEIQKHKNSYATNNEGFWNSTIFKIVK